MTTLRLQRRRSMTAAVAGLLALAATMVTGAPAAADPTAPPQPPAPTTPVPRGSGNGAVGSPSTPAQPSNPAIGAPGTISWSAQPSSAGGPDGRKVFTYDNLKPGIAIHDYIGVTNFSSAPVTFSLYAADAFNTTSGSLDLLAADKKSKDVGSWITFPKNSLTIQPGERVNEPFTVTIPSNASPGDHTGGVISSTLLPATNAQGAKVNVERRLAVPLYLRVSGPLHPGLTIESVSTRYHGTYNPIGGGDIDVTYTVHNAGNFRVDLSQDVSVTGFFGITLARVQGTRLTNLLPGSSYSATAHIKGVFPAGLMRVHVTGRPSQVSGVPPAQVKLEAVSFGVGMWATPWLVILIVVLLVGGFLGVRWLLRSRRQRRDAAVAAAMEKARRDTVEALRKKAAAKVAADRGAGKGTST
jgi:Bacterial protein of unknown function (DUF916)